MLLQAVCVISAGFSHTALRQPCVNAACQRPELRIYATAAADDNDARIRLKSLLELPDEAGAEWAERERVLRLVGGDVWASTDLFRDDKLAVKKHTKGYLHPKDYLHFETNPDALPVVSWEHRVDDIAGQLIIIAKPLWLTSREPPLPGGATRGEGLATGDLSSASQDKRYGTYDNSYNNSYDNSYANSYDNSYDNSCERRVYNDKSYIMQPTKGLKQELREAGSIILLNTMPASP